VQGFIWTLIRVSDNLAILQMGYNLLYGLHKASYDADCSLFLNILKEEVKVRRRGC
jgi:hypothetical protein